MASRHLATTEEGKAVIETNHGSRIMNSAATAEGQASLAEFMRRVHQGVGTDILDELLAYGLTTKEVAAAVAPLRTLSRRRKEGRLSLEEGDRALVLLSTLERAVSVFGQEAKAVRWLRKPKQFLDGQTPIEALHTTIGANLVNDRLLALEHGLF